MINLKSVSYFLALSLILLINSCGSQKEPTSSNQKETEFSIVGDWYKGIEPGVHAFLKDGSYHIHLPGEETEKGEIVIKGSWEIKDKKLITKHEDGFSESKMIHWLNKDQFFLGDYNPEVHKSQDEDGMYSRAKEE